LRILDKLQPLALLVLRLVLGIIMIGHGYPKVFGGLHHHVQMVSGLGLPGWLAYCSAAAEFLGGILVVVGLLTRLAALAITVNLAVAIVKVHWHNGLLGNGGYQFPLALAAIAFALIFLGAGPIALESLRGGVGSGRSGSARSGK
jgi:putative oxidoreductase